MGSSSENQNQFKPYYINDRDCSLGICTKYCSQFCYIAFPPPPQDGSSSPFSPLIVTIIVVLAGAFLLAVSYYLIITRYCKNRRRRRSSVTVFQQQGGSEEMASTTTNDQSQAATSPPSGLDETLIKTITVCKYRKGDGLIEGTDCAVCLNEFEEDESLRLLPKCRHAFHLPCIDAWLRSHSSCPLCRAGVVVFSPQSANENAWEIRQRPPNHLVLLVVDEEVRVLSVVSEGNDDDEHHHDDVSTKRPDLDRGIEEDRERASRFKRSFSLGTFCEDLRAVSNDECSSSNGLMSDMKRSASSEGYIFTENSHDM